MESGIEGCLDIGMIRGEDGSLAFRHELARRALEGSIPAVEAERAARARAGDPFRAAGDFIRAARTSRGLLRANADEVLRHAPAAAAQAVGGRIALGGGVSLQSRSALRRATSPPEDRARLQELLAYECYLTDQIGQAAEARREALEVWRASGNRLKEGTRSAGCRA